VLDTADKKQTGNGYKRENNRMENKRQVKQQAGNRHMRENNGQSVDAGYNT
jgi:hypothetical protein